MGGPVHYLDFGGAGSPVVCVHGLGGSSHDWLAIGPLLAARHRVVALDLTGFGRTPPMGRSCRVPELRRLLSDFIRHVSDEPVLLMGNSMGGLLSMLQAEAEPDTVGALVLVNPALPVKGLHVDPMIARQFAAFAIPGVAERVLRRGAEVPAAQQVAQVLETVTVDAERVEPGFLEEAEALAEQRRRYDWAHDAFIATTRSLLRTLLSRRAHRRRVAAISAPALIIHGVGDRLVSVAAAEELVRLRPDWQLTILDDIGHVPQLEAAGEVLEIVETWLAELRRAASAAAAG